MSSDIPDEETKMRLKSQAEINNHAKTLLTKEDKKESEISKKEKLRQAVRELVSKSLEGFLTNQGKAGYYKEYNNSIGLSEDEFKSFLYQMAIPKKFPYIKPEKDPRESRYEGSKDGTISRVIDYCVDNTIYIWNIDHAEFE